ncbi:MAG TPA: NUDIX domain-containing protein [Thermoplasmata archaeon]|nr:NUDIX domain-containing protein [Thermoplasmata archaeon]
MALGLRDGHREFLVRSCGILIHGDRVLFQEGEDGRGGKQYALPGGHLEFGETLALCMSREVYEETGLNVEADKLVYVHENFYTLKGVDTHEIGFYFLVDLSSEFPAPDANGYVRSLESHIRMRLLPLAKLRGFPVMPPFLAEYLPQDARELFVHPTRHLIEQRA